jgi:hypothetical protein
VGGGLSASLRVVSAPLNPRPKALVPFPSLYLLYLLLTLVLFVWNPRRLPTQTAAFSTPNQCAVRRYVCKTQPAKAGWF